jgi:hypothetical protein
MGDKKGKIGNIEYYGGNSNQNQSICFNPHYRNCLLFYWDKDMPEGDKAIFDLEDIDYLMDIRELPKILISRN